jgi:hypothetical protein
LDADTIAYIEQLLAKPMAIFGYVPRETVPAAFTNHLPEFFQAVGQRLGTAEEQLVQLAREVRSLRRR